jgi:ubiquinone/menaquinone biosynthesis C-methylase UbiE
VDISGAMVERARANLGDVPNVSLDTGSITAIPQPDGSFDRVLAYSVLQYLADEAAVERALVEVARVLKPGGRALLAANPDPARRQALEDVVRTRNSPEAAEQELAIVARTLWAAPERLAELARGVGLEARWEPLSPRIRQHFYMFDLVVDKP